MTARQILVKPVITEKSNNLSETMNRYTFIVARSANKIEIKSAVEEMYGVNVSAVRTLVNPAKDRTRFTKTGVTKGRTQARKKAVVTLAKGETIDFYSNI